MKSYFSVIIFICSIVWPTIGKADSSFLLDYIESGREVIIDFDQTFSKFDDEPWSGSSSTDPMGTLKGGEEYRLYYYNGNFVVTGFNEGTGNVGTWVYSNGNLAWNQISLWGRVYSFSSAGDVFDPTYGLVGHIQLP